MKGHRQLHQSLEMPAAWLGVSGLAPNIFEHLVGVEKMSAIEQIKTASQAFAVDSRFGHFGHASRQISKNIPIFISQSLSMIP